MAKLINAEKIGKILLARDAYEMSEKQMKTKEGLIKDVNFELDSLKNQLFVSDNQMAVIKTQIQMKKGELENLKNSLELDKANLISAGRTMALELKGIEDNDDQESKGSQNLESGPSNMNNSHDLCIHIDKIQINLKSKGSKKIRAIKKPKYKYKKMFKK